MPGKEDLVTQTCPTEPGKWSWPRKKLEEQEVVMPKV